MKKLILMGLIGLFLALFVSVALAGEYTDWVSGYKWEGKTLDEKREMIKSYQSPKTRFDKQDPIDEDALVNAKSWMEYWRLKELNEAKLEQAQREKIQAEREEEMKQQELRAKWKVLPIGQRRELVKDQNINEDALVNAQSWNDYWNWDKIKEAERLEKIYQEQRKLEEQKKAYEDRVIKKVDYPKGLGFRDIYLRQPIEDGKTLATRYNRANDADIYHVNVEGDKTVQMIAVMPNSDSNDRFKEAVFKKYGKANSFKVTHYQNAFGAKWEGFDAYWNVGKDNVWLLFSPSDGRMIFTLIIETSEYTNKTKKGEIKF